jgi:hypothetical protein
MIPNPENVFEQLQNDVATKLMQTSPFSTIRAPDGSAFAVLTEDEGDIQFEYDAMISQLGLCIVVHAPSGEISQPDMPGPVITKLGFDVWVSEAPLFNRSELGTNVRLFKAMGVVMGTLHLFQPESTQSPIYIENFKRERERTYINNDDKKGTLINSLICHFIVPQVGALITNQ